MRARASERVLDVRAGAHERRRPRAQMGPLQRGTRAERGGANRLGGAGERGPVAAGVGHRKPPLVALELSPPLQHLPKHLSMPCSLVDILWPTAARLQTACACSIWISWRDLMETGMGLLCFGWPETWHSSTPSYSMHTYM
jgi:hypothetical protein